MQDPIDALQAQGRTFATAVPAELLTSVQKGVMTSVYRGVPFLKSPFDIGIYLQLLSRLQPRTVIEVGTKHGGSALWFADMMSAAGVVEPRVVSVDIQPLAKFTDPRITFLKGEAAHLDAVLDAGMLSRLARPWLVVEDSSHLYEDSLAVLRFFDAHLRKDDVIAVEDGIVSHLPAAAYRRYEHGPNRAVRDFLQEAGERYRIDAALCDFYGYNATYNPNGFLMRQA